MNSCSTFRLLDKSCKCLLTEPAHQEGGKEGGSKKKKKEPPFQIEWGPRERKRERDREEERGS